MIGIGVPHPAVQLRGSDDQAIGCFGTLAAEGVDLGAQRSQAVGLVTPKVSDAGQPGHRSGFGQRRDGGDRRREFADVIEIDIEPAVAGCAPDL